MVFSGCLTSHNKYPSVRPAILKRITSLRKCIFDRNRKEIEKHKLKKPFKSPDVCSWSSMRPRPHEQEEMSAHVGTDRRFPYMSGQILGCG